nr:hypothetical protein [Tanacetum cinerariifolium]
VSAVEGNRNNVVKSLACWIWRPKGNLIDHISKDSGSYTLKRFNYVDPQGRLKIFDSRCSRHMIGNKSYLTDYQEINGGFVAFGGNAKGGRKLALSFMRPFGYPVTILNTLYHLGNQTNGNAGTKANINARQAGKKTVLGPQYDPAKEGGKNDQEKDLRDQEEAHRKQCKQEFERLFGQKEAANTNSTNRLNIVSSPVNVDANDNRMLTPVNAAESTYVNLDTTDLQDIGIFSGAYDDEVEGVVADFNKLELTIVVSPIPTTRIYKDHPKEQIIWDLLSAPQTRRMTKTSQEHAIVSYIKKQRRTNHKDYQNCLFACFLSQIEPKKVYRNKKDERGILVRNKVRLVEQGYTQEEGIDYDEVFAPVTRIEAIKLFFAYASFMRFIVYQIDVKSAFLYGIIKWEVYMCQPYGFEDPHFPDKVYKVEKALYGLHQASRACQDKYVADIFKKFDFSSVKTASTPIETNKALLKDEKAEDMDVHLYRLMIGSLMYLTASKSDIMFIIGACARF